MKQAWTGVLVAAAVALLHAGLLLSRGSPWALDRITQALPWEHAVQAAAARGELPAWEPGLFAGYPLIGGQARPFSPPLMLARATGDPLLAIDLELFLLVVGAAVSGAAAARMLGQGPAGSAAAGIVWALGALLPWHESPSIAASAAWHPLLFACAWTGRWRGLALLVGLVGLGGYPYQVGFGLGIAGVATLFGPGNGAPLVRRLLGLGLAAGVGLLLAGVQLAPTFELLTNSHRWIEGMSTNERAQALVAPLDLRWWVWPFVDLETRYSTRYELLSYMGLLGVLLAGAGALRAFPRGDAPDDPARRCARTLLALAAGSLALALLLSTSAGLAAGELPLLRLVRGPTRLLLVAQLALAFLAGWGVDRLARLAPRGAWLVVLVVSLDLVQYAQRLADPVDREALRTPPRVAELVGEGARIRVVGTRELPAPQAPWGGEIPRGPAAREALRRDHPLDPSCGLLFGVEHLDGYEALRPIRIERWLRGGDLLARHRRSATTDLVIHPRLKLPAPFQEVERSRRWAVYRVPDPLPRVRSCTRVALAKDGLDALAMSDRAGDDEAVLEPQPGAEEAAAALAPVTSGSPGALSFERRGSRELALALRLERPAMAVVADAWYPGWRAELDGREVPCLVVDGVWKGALVPAGAHELRFLYTPIGLRTGRVLSPIGAAALLAWAILATYRRGRGAAGRHPP